MLYKILPGTELFDKLSQFKQRIKEVDEAIEAYVKSVGGKSFAVNTSSNVKACDVVQFEGKPEGWVYVGPKWQCFFRPAASNKKAWAAIHELPRVTNDELNEILGFSFHVGGDLGVYHRPGVSFGSKHHLVKYPENYVVKGVVGLVELKQSEYNKLMKVNEAEQEAEKA